MKDKKKTFKTVCVSSAIEILNILITNKKKNREERERVFGQSYDILLYY